MSRKPVKRAPANGSECQRVNFEIENDDQTSMEVEVKATGAGAFREVDDRGFIVPEAVLPGRRLPIVG